jgi:4-diphosphocytidyl-2-C-methyl-D-erythritol kinase
LGGGSSDAAVTLAGLNRLWSLGMTRERLAEVAALIGSDVPFFLYGGTCQAEGRGEKLTRLPDIEKKWFILVKPPLLVQPGKTGRLYGLIGPSQ